MANGQIQKLLEFADQQMAAEAFLAQANDIIANLPRNEDIRARLIEGNTHASKFTPAQATQFTTQYEVLTQYRNDPLDQIDGIAKTGFSATLFRNRQTNELTLSFRSTEFLDDQVRDSTATNKLEVKELGWALGQIAEMETWYAQLRANPALLGSKNFNVTGYSLGGHLATAFNILRREEAVETGFANPVIASYTFNGAGTGGLVPGKRLTDLLADFNRIRANPYASPELAALTLTERTNLLSEAQSRVNTINSEVARIAALPGLKNANFENATAPAGMQATLEYQLAALLVKPYTIPSSTAPSFLPGGTNWIPVDPVFAPAADRFANMTEVVGMEMAGFAPSFVSNSGVHYGARQEVYIEDQPFTRGTYAAAGDVVANPGTNDVGDTHSLVLLVDSLSLMATMEKLAPAITIESARQIYAAMSNTAAQTVRSSGPDGQGKAEGDTLERMLDALRKLVLGPAIEPTLNEDQMRQVLLGNTWHDATLRTKFQNNLKDLRDYINTYVANNSAPFTIDNLTTIGSKQLAAIAASSEAIAYRYALQELNPFAVLGDTAAADFYQPKNMSGKLDLYNATDRTGTMTTQWITDRAAFLVWKNIANTQNTLTHSSGVTVLQSALIDESLRYIDLAHKIHIGIVPPGGTVLALTDVSRFVFGGDSIDVLTGGVSADGLYGGSGTDLLIGGRDADYLEGGSGHDIYEYNTALSLIGSNDDGADVIRDTDGKGVLRLLYQPLVGGFFAPRCTVIADASVKVSENQWKSADGKFIYTKDGADLQVTYNSALLLGQTQTASTITLKDFRDGDFNINLGTRGERATPTSFNYEFVGDFAPLETTVNLPVNFTIDPAWLSYQIMDTHYDTSEPPVAISYDIKYTLADAARNPQPGEPDINRIDSPRDTTGNDRIYLLGGNDFFGGNGHFSAAAGGNDWVSGGIGRDIIRSGAGDDLLEGGADGVSEGIIGGDIIAGGDGDDDLYGNVKITLEQAIAEGATATGSGLKGDWLNGGIGDDYIVGHTGDDVLLGGVGFDVLVGGAGNDVLNGEDDFTATSLDWTVSNGSEFFTRFYEPVTDNNVFPFSGSADVLYGGAGNDYLFGGFGDDLLYGETGDDTLSGGADNDVLVGGDGDDSITGDFGTLVFHAAGAFIQGNDYLDGGAGNDWLQGEGGDDMLFGGAGNDTLLGDATYLNGALNGNDYLAGGDGNDTLAGFGGNDVLIGGLGDDALVGGAGKDTYIFNRGDGVEIIFDEDDRDGNLDEQGNNTNPNKSTIVFGDGINQSQLTFRRGSLMIDLGEGDAIHLSLPDGQDDLAATRLFGSLQFADGSSMSFEDVLAQGFDIDGTAGNDNNEPGEPDSLIGTSVSDRVRGFAGNDVLDGRGGIDILTGGSGNDTLYGGAGQDTYHFNRGDGSDVIDDFSTDTATAAEASVLALGAGISRNQLKFRIRDGLIVDLGPSSADDPFAASDQIRFVGFNASVPSLTPVVGEIRFADSTSMTYADILAQGFDLDGTALDDAGVNALIGAATNDRIRGYAGSDDIAGGDGNDLLTGDSGTDTLDGGDGNDVLDGGAGNDRLLGGLGSDDYRFITGDGSDTLIEGSLYVAGLADPGTADRIVFGAGIARADVALKRHADGSLVVAYGLGDEIRVEGHYSVSGAAIESIVFADGAVITQPELDALQVSAVEGTADADELYGTAGDDVMRGYAGSDYLDGGPAPENRAPGAPLLTGNDRMDGGMGADTYALYWGMGADRIIEAVDGQTNTLTLLEGATVESVNASREGDDLLVTLRGSNDGARVEGFFVNGGAASWQIASAADGSQSLLDWYTAQSTADNAAAINAMADYKQRVLAEWRAQGQSDFALPTHAYVGSSRSQTTIQWYRFGPPPQPATIHVSAPETYSSIQGLGKRQGAHIVPVGGRDIVHHRLVTPAVESTVSDAAVIGTEWSAAATSNFTSYSFNAGVAGSFSHVRSYSSVVPDDDNPDTPGFKVYSTEISSSEGWASIFLRTDNLGQFPLIVHQSVEIPVVEEITAGASSNQISGVLDDSSDHVALIDAGAGDDTVTAGARDFVFGNDGNDSISGGAYAFGGDGNDTLTLGSIMAGGTGDDALSGGEGETLFSVRAADAGSDTVQDVNGISLHDFAVKAGLVESESNFVYGGKYRVEGEASARLQGMLENRLGGHSAFFHYIDAAFTRLQDVPLGFVIPGDTTGFLRGVPDLFYPGPYRSDGYYTWVYNTVDDMMRDFNTLGLPFSPAYVQRIAEVVDLSSFTANNYAVLRPYFESGVLESDVVELADFRVGVDQLTVSLGAADSIFAGHRSLHLAWGADKVIDIELPLATDLIGYGIEQVRLGQQSVYIGDLINLAAASDNHAPTLANAIVDQAASEDAVFSYIIPANTFADVDAGDTLTYSATKADGSALPAWLTFNAATRTFSGTPVNGDVGAVSLKLTATDGASASVFDTFEVTVANTNDAPTLANAIADQSATEDAGFSYTVPANTFADVDVGDTLTYSASQANGSALPAWLTFNAATRTFSGTPANGNAGASSLKLTAIDGANASVFDTFEVTVANTNDAPTLANAITDQSATEDAAFSYTVPANTFADVDVGDTLTYSATQGDGSALPTWLSFNAATHTFSGMPMNDDVGTLSVKVKTMDGAGENVSDSFDIVVANTNDAPTLTNVIADQLATEDAVFSYTVPANTFADVDVGDTLTYSATKADGSALPTWLNFNTAPVLSAARR